MHSAIHVHKSTRCVALVRGLTSQADEHEQAQGLGRLAYCCSRLRCRQSRRRAGVRAHMRSCRGWLQPVCSLVVVAAVPAVRVGFIGHGSGSKMATGFKVELNENGEKGEEKERKKIKIPSLSSQAKIYSIVEFLVPRFRIISSVRSVQFYS